nr:MtnX-like HAD-IB family phosphatase [Tissierella sp.]
MIENIDLKDVAILVDFDGTITTEDTNTRLIDHFGDRDKTRAIRKDFNEGKINFPQYFDKEIDQLRISEEEYIDFLLEEIELSPGFLEFYKIARQKDITIGIISGGFSNGIVPYLKKYGIDDIEIFSNKLIFDENGPSIEFLDGKDTMCCDKGPCGNCKIKHYNRYKKIAEKVIFVGDGVTDMPVAEEADIVFAKDALADYLDKKDIGYIEYGTFNDINNIIFK